MIITLTESAKQHIQKMLENKPENSAFRLSIKKTGCSGYMYMPEIVSEKKESDVVVDANTFLIFIDESAVPFIKGTEIDYVKKGLGVYQLEFHNPNAEGLCGCGESFQIKDQ